MEKHTGQPCFHQVSLLVGRGRLCAGCCLVTGPPPEEGCLVPSEVLCLCFPLLSFEPVCGETVCR